MMKLMKLSTDVTELLIHNFKYPLIVETVVSNEACIKCLREYGKIIRTNAKFPLVSYR